METVDGVVATGPPVRLPKRKTGKFYHGTHADIFTNIRNEGLRCACEPGMGATKDYCDTWDAFGIVCLTDDPKKARFYSVVTTKMSMKLPEEDMLIVEVDPEYLEDAHLIRRLSSKDGDWCVSREFDYRLRIPPEALTFYKWDNTIRDFVRLDLPPRRDW